MRYASQTTVPIERSRSEIERIIARYGAQKFMYGTDQKQAMIAFESHGRAVRMIIPMPTTAEVEKTPTGRVRHNKYAIEGLLEQARRQRWRALCVVILAKFEAIESGISTFEEEFLGWTMLRNGKTVFEHLNPDIERAIKGGTMPQLLLPGHHGG